MNKNLSKNFFLISFLPAIAYWYLEENYPLKIAITGGLILAILEIAFEKIFTKHVHTLSKFNFCLIAFLGAISLVGDDGIWFKLQPAFTGVGIAAFLAYRLIVGKGMMLEMMESFHQEGKPKPPELIIRTMESHVAVLFGAYGIFMAGIAWKAPTDYWLFFKTIGFYIVFAIFMVIEFFIIRLKVKQMAKRQQQYEILKQMTRHD